MDLSIKNKDGPGPGSYLHVNIETQTADDLDDSQVKTDLITKAQTSPTGSVLLSK